MWILALMGLLAVPDICAALADTNGETSKQKYLDWFDPNISPKYPTIYSPEFYKMRCSMLHQGASATSNYTRTLFAATAPGFTFGNLRGMINDALWLDMPSFCADVIQAVASWVAANANDEPVKTNLANLIQWHPDGYPPYISGVAGLT